MSAAITNIGPTHFPPQPLIDEEENPIAQIPVVHKRFLEIDKSIPSLHHPNEFLVSYETIGDKLKKELKLCREDQKNQILNPFFGDIVIPYETTTLIEQVGSSQVGIAHAQGIVREYMEDTHITALCRSEFQGNPIKYELFGIIDGHTGMWAANFVATHIQDEIERAISKYGTSDEGMFIAFKEACVRLDVCAIHESFKKGFSGGAVAVFCIKIGSELWTANVGDCRAILKIGDQVVQLSVDAKPSITRFRKGVEKRGGVVLTAPHGRSRVNGTLAVARAFSDGHIVGRQAHPCHAISARPKITKISLESKNEELSESSETDLKCIGSSSCMQTSPSPVLILACDGIWNVASSQNVASLIKEGAFVESAAERIVLAALNAGSEDNCSALVVRLS